MKFIEGPGWPLCRKKSGHPHMTLGVFLSMEKACDWSRLVDWPSNQVEEHRHRPPLGQWGAKVKLIICCFRFPFIATHRENPRGVYLPRMRLKVEIIMILFKVEVNTQNLVKQSILGKHERDRTTSGTTFICVYFRFRIETGPLVSSN